MAKGIPTAEELLELAKETIKEHGQRDTMFTDLEPYYFLDKEKEDGSGAAEGVEVVHLPHGTNAVDLVQDLLADTEPGIAVPASGEGPTRKKLADTTEKYLLAVMHQSEKAQKQSILSRAAWLIAMRGCIAGRVMGIERWLDRDEEAGTWRTGQRVPLLLQLRDPLYVFPSFGLDGLAYIVEQRTRKVKDLRNSLGDELLPKAKLNDEVEWIEYWDDTYFCYWADGEPVALGAGNGPWPHRYGGMPYSFEFARQTGKMEPEDRVRPLLQGVRGAIDRLDLTDSAEATFIMGYSGDALNVFTEGEQEYDTRSGAINFLEPTDRVEWLRASRQALEMEKAGNKYAAQLQKGTFPDTMYGMDPGRIMAGYALSMLNQSGQLRLKPILHCLEEFLGELLEHALMISEHYITELINEPIPFHLVTDTEDDEGNAYRRKDELTLDASKLQGWYQVEVSLGEIMPADQQANLMLALKSREMGPDGRPLLSWETAVDNYGLVKSVVDERDRIDRELAMNDPAVAALRQRLILETVKQELAEELEQLGISPEEVLAEFEAKQMAQQQQPPVEQVPPGMDQVLQQPVPQTNLPPELLAAAMQGQLMPQPMGEMMGPGVPQQGPGGMPPLY